MPWDTSMKTREPEEKAHIVLLDSSAPTRSWESSIPLEGCTFSPS